MEAVVVKPAIAYHTSLQGIARSATLLITLESTIIIAILSLC